MRIALICHPHHPIREPWAGGMEMHTAMLSRALQERGHRITLYAKDGSEVPSGTALVPIESAAQEYELNPDAQRSAVQAQRTADAIRRACEQISGTDDDLVLNNSLSALPHELLSSRRLLTIMHSPVPVPDFVELFARLSALPERHRFATVSESNAQAWRQHFPHVAVLPNGVDIDYWAAASRTRTSAETAGERPAALWTGRITRQKGLHLAIAAARQAQVELRISGLRSDPAYFEEEVAPSLRSQDAQGKGDPLAPIYLGHLAHHEIREELSRADVFIASPLWAEPFGLAPVEAMGAGTPVAASPRGAMPELIREGGAVAASTSPEDLADAIRRALRISPEAARANASRYSLEAMAERFEELAAQIP